MLTNALRSFLRKFQLDVEFLVWLFAVCNTAKSVLSPHLAEEKMRQVYGPSLPPSNDTAAVQKALNAEMVLWEQRVQLIQLPLACASSLLFGAFSDHSHLNGRRRWLILLGLSGSCLDLAVRLLVWSTPAPLWLLLASACVVGCMGGGNFVFMCASNARVVDKDRIARVETVQGGDGGQGREANDGKQCRLSARMLLFSALFSVGALLGAQLAGQLATRLSHPIALGTTLALLFCSLPLATFLMREPQKAENAIEGDVAKEWRLRQLPWQALQTAKSLPGGIWRMFSFGGLPFGFCLAGLFLCNSVFSEETALFGVYTRLAPFYWETGQLGLYNSIRSIAQLAGMCLGAVLLRLGLLLEHGLLQLATLSLVGIGLCVAFATNSILLFASLAAGAPHGLFAPMVYSLLAEASPPDEAGTLFALLLIVERLALFGQSQVLQSIYRLSLNWHQEFIWFLVSALAAIASAFFAAAKISQRRRRNGEEEGGEAETAPF